MTRTVYLAGGITFHLDPSGWRETAKSLLPQEWAAVDPTIIDANLWTAEQIVKADYGSILTVDVVLADITEPSWGTAMEIAFAKQHGIPVVGWGHPDRMSPWLRYHLTMQLPTLRGAVMAIVDKAWA